MKKFIVLVLCFVCLCGCSNENDTIISLVEAKEKIINEGAILMDVRTEEEYNQEHIDGAVLLTLDTINEESVANVVSSKDDVIIVYCQSGNRSHQALEQLKSLGYTEVYDFGAMSNWK